MNNSLVTFDNAKGIEDAVTSLIQEQQCRKIGMIAGPYENKGSDERLAASSIPLALSNVTSELFPNLWFKVTIGTPSNSFTNNSFKRLFP